MDRSLVWPLVIGSAGGIACLLGGFAFWRARENSSNAGEPIATVIGVSMAPTLHGESLVGDCESCRGSLRFDLASLSGPRDLVCPNCGASNPWELFSVRAADRLRVRPLPARESPQIGALYVLAAPDGEEREPIVKRVVAGPGERVTIAGGELFRNGALVRKDLIEDNFPAVLVHDGRYLTTRDPRSPFRAGTTLLDFAPRAVWSPVDTEAASPVLDWYPSVVVERRRLNAVPDVWMELRIDRARPVDTTFLYRSAERDLRIVVTDEGEWTFDASDDAVPSAKGKLSDWSEEVRFGMLDRRLFVAPNSSESIVIELPADLPITPVERPLAIDFGGNANADVRFGEVRRDLHYLSPTLGEEPWSETEDASLDGWFVLGDNPGGSIDSRRFGRVAREDFLGEALMPAIEDRTE